MRLSLELGHWSRPLALVGCCFSDRFHAIADERCVRKILQLPLLSSPEWSRPRRAGAMPMVGRAKVSPQMRALLLHPVCLKHLTFLQTRVNLLLPMAPPQRQLRVKQSLMKTTQAPLRYMELAAVICHLRFMESHRQGLTVPFLLHPVAGPMGGGGLRTRD